MTWKLLKKHFKHKYLTKRYFDEKSKEFHDLILEKMLIKKFVTKFLSLMRYVPYLREEMEKIQ